MNKVKSTYYIIVGFFCILGHCSVAQNQSIADSLKAIYEQEKLTDTVKFEILRNLAFNEQDDYNLALNYTKELIRFAEEKENTLYRGIGFFQKGNIKKILGDLNEAIDAYFSCIHAIEGTTNQILLGGTYGAIADVYSMLNNHTNAMLYYKRAISTIRHTGDSIQLASWILNAGDEYLIHGDYDSALFYFEESGTIFEKTNYPTGQAYNLGNMGMAYANKGQNTLAEENINKAIQMLAEAEDYYPVCSYLIAMSDIYLDRKEMIMATNYAHKSLELAKKYKLKQQISDASLKLSELYETSGNTEKALQLYKNHIAYRDSVNNIETVRKIADQRTEFEINLKNKEINLLEQNQRLDRTYIAIAIILLILSIVLLLYFRQRFLTTKLVASNERKKHDDNIKNLLRAQETKALESMVQGRESERKHLAQELHNHLGSLLATIKVNVNGIEEKAIPNHATLTKLIDQACTDIRNISHSLNMGISEGFGLIPSLKELVNHLRQSGDLEVEFSTSMSDYFLDSEEEITVYRIVQELVSNVLKHAEATKISILLTCFEEDNLINIIVQDNGKGIQKKSKHPDSIGIGLSNLQHMVDIYHGEMKLDSSSQSGTTVSIDLPLKPKLVEI